MYLKNQIPFYTREKSKSLECKPKMTAEPSPGSACRSGGGVQRLGPRSRKEPDSSMLSSQVAATAGSSSPGRGGAKAPTPGEWNGYGSMCMRAMAFCTRGGTYKAGASVPRLLPAPLHIAHAGQLRIPPGPLRGRGHSSTTPTSSGKAEEHAPLWGRGKLKTAGPCRRGRRATGRRRRRRARRRRHLEPRGPCRPCSAATRSSTA